MIITKKKFTQTILIGLLFAFMLGGLSWVIQTIMIPVPKVTEKQMIIIENIGNNVIQKNLNNLNQVNYRNKVILLTQELYKSIKYTKIRYSKDEEPISLCTTFTMNLTDNSIFISTTPYVIENRKKIENCLENLFNLSFERLKKKFTFENYQELSEPNLSLNNENQNIILEEDKSSLDQNARNCNELDISYNKLIKKFLLVLENGILLDENENYKDKSLLEVLNLNQNLVTVRTLRNEVCGNKPSNTSLELRNKYIFNLKQLNSAIKNSSLTNVFRIEKIRKLQDTNNNQYLSLKNIVTTFSLFGFIFGVLLFYNFGISKKKNE